MLPNLVIAGVNKAGTTSLFSYLAQHPGVCPSSVKETCYFLPIRYGKEISPVSHYQRLFSKCSREKIMIEATPGYFYGGKKLAMKIDSTLSNVKVVILLRDPATRLFSFFNFMKSMLMIPQELTFSDYINCCQSFSRDELLLQENNPYFGLEGGYYNRHMSDWLEVFGERLKILFFEDLKENPHALLINLCRWLQIDEKYYEDYYFSVANKTTKFKNRWLHSIAITINKNFEPFFRQYPEMKNIITKLYSRCNLEIKNKSVDIVDWVMVRSLYHESNQELKKILNDRSISPIPGWLQGSNT